MGLLSFALMLLCLIGSIFCFGIAALTAADDKLGRADTIANIGTLLFVVAVLICGWRWQW